MKYLAVLVVPLIAGCIPEQEKPELREVTIISVYDERREWSNANGTTVVETPSGRRIPMAGRLGQPGEKFKAYLYSNQ